MKELTEELIKEHTRKLVDKRFYVNASVVALNIEYADFNTTGWRFEKIRAVAEHEIEIYKQSLKK